MIVLLADTQVHPARVARHHRAARRLRLEVPGLVGDRHLGRRLEQTVGAWPGIVEARANPLSGRVLIRYSPGTPLLAELHEEGREAAAPPRNGRRTERQWHALSVADVLEELGSGPDGLDHAEAAARLRRYGANLVEPVDERSRLEIAFGQVANLPMGLLFGSAGLAAVTGQALEATAILVVIGLNAAIGYRIESKNQEILASWRKLESGVALAVRGGSLVNVAATELVPGDVLVCRSGDVLPADARLIESRRLAADEAPLTGESEAQQKSDEPVPADEPLAQRTSMLYAGSTVVAGSGRAVVVATAGATELARVRRLVETSQAPQAPVTKRLESLSNGLAWASLGAAGLSAGLGLLRGRSFARVLQSAVALGVAAIPEGLPIVATAALVRSMQRLHRHGMIVRRLAASEALGTVSVICADKTGTLTRNEMRLEAIDLGDGAVDPATITADPERILEDPGSLLLAAGLLNSEVEEVRGETRLAGSSTERALVLGAEHAGLDGARLRQAFPRRELRERSRGVRYVVSLHDAPDGELVAFVKGAPGQVIDLCDRDRSGALGDEGRARLRESNAALASAGLRVLAFAWKRFSEGEDPSHLEGGLTFIGLAGLRDPIREGAGEAIRLARRAGIRTVILTGDQRRTAEAIAGELDLGGGTLLASELATLGRDELARRLDRTAVLARITPEEKLAVVKLLQERGEIVAMAGDGINDAPALKVADVGISVGARASDLARQVADLVMAGDDLRTILAAVGEGRIVQDNLRRSLHFICATNLSELALILGALLVGLPEPLLPLQLLWLNLLSDTLPALALALEPGKPEVLDRPPAVKGAPLIDGEDLRRLVRDGGWMTAMGAGAMILGGPPLAFAVLPTAQLGYAVACRAPRRGSRQERAGADARFAGLVGSAALLHLGGLVVPQLRRVLRIPAPTPLLLGGFAVGLAAPMLLSAAPRIRVIRRGGESR
ncbi:cation-translocating P-type ATPase [Vulgatibacter incomptus]|uniref:Cation-transporting ATPase, E1-E2 family n=1 Tax=Vulgatibacter incomptus TaxID=1391653 RepID=A0A0K1PET3_9BACT|nr:cation-transporting P-type ATPase [Vulgatibacter incomptus]AKU92043.1 Cation-transporting ATPase, E1-E2 family [Vulgatibacter incomptus]